MKHINIYVGIEYGLIGTEIWACLAQKSDKQKYTYLVSSQEAHKISTSYLASFKLSKYAFLLSQGIYFGALELYSSILGHDSGGNALVYW